MADIEKILQSLSSHEQAWQQGNRLLVWRYERWHYLTLAFDMSQIVAVSFMEAERVRRTLSNMIDNADFTQFSDIAPIFVDELARKVLPNAEAYRPLLENGRCRLIIGHTTDTLRPVEADIDTLIQIIQQRMNGKPGAYISFH